MQLTKNETLAYRFLAECDKGGLGQEDLLRVLEILHWEIIGKQNGSTYLGVPGKMGIVSESLSLTSVGLSPFWDPDK